MDDEKKAPVAIEGWELITCGEIRIYRDGRDSVCLQDEGLSVVALSRKTIPMPVIKALLIERGLDICTKAERKVLEAMAVAKFYQNGSGQWRFGVPAQEGTVVNAEIARRKESNG